MRALDLLDIHIDRGMLIQYTEYMQYHGGKTFTVITLKMWGYSPICPAAVV